MASIDHHSNIPHTFFEAEVMGKRLFSFIDQIVIIGHIRSDHALELTIISLATTSNDAWWYYPRTTQPHIIKIVEQCYWDSLPYRVSIGVLPEIGNRDKYHIEY